VSANHLLVQMKRTMPWKTTVSSVQRSRKKRYWFRMLWLARKPPPVAGRCGDEVNEASASVALMGSPDDGAGGRVREVGDVEGDGESFSMRAQVR
jgi:hypothetical protein